jgi:regulatory protein
MPDDQQRTHVQDPARAAFALGMRLLARRELSEAQLRQRLTLRSFAPDVVEAALGRLRLAGAADDRRVAVSCARTEALVRHRGRDRILRRLDGMGIDPQIAQEAVDRVFQEVDEESLLERALVRRFRGGASVASAAEYRRLYQYLVRKGFSGFAVKNRLRLLTKRGLAVPDDL